MESGQVGLGQGWAVGPAWEPPTRPLPKFPWRGALGARGGRRWGPGGERWALRVCLATGESPAPRALIA